MFTAMFALFAVAAPAQEVVEDRQNQEEEVVFSQSEEECDDLVYGDYSEEQIVLGDESLIEDIDLSNETLTDEQFEELTEE